MLSETLVCPEHHEMLAFVKDNQLACPAGCQFPILSDIPRFVPSNDYAEAFGLQWDLFRKTQLDSYTGTTISRDRLRRCLGGDLAILRDTMVLEAGCGAGQFTEILASQGAHVFALDLSSAVEANLANRREQEAHGEKIGSYFVCQASILRPPVRPRSFDFVVALGVVQHTPDPSVTIQALASCVKPGGVLTLDHYSLDYDVTWSRRLMRALLLQLPPRAASKIALTMARMLTVLHRLFWRPGRLTRAARRVLRHLSPLVDYYDGYPQLPHRIWQIGVFSIRMTP